jgi:ribosomal protein S6
MDEKEKKEYELAVLIKQEEDLALVTTLVRQHNGEITLEPRAKRLTLAYEIKKNKEAVFAHMNFRALGEDAKSLESDLNNKAEVLRSLIIADPVSMQMTADASAQAAPKRRTRVMRPTAAPTEGKPAAPQPLSNEALEKKIEEILQ